MAFKNKQSVELKKEEDALQVLRTLREKLLSDDISTARLAAHNLSWLQEDGLTILKEALLGNYPKTTKQAAAYGLRKMVGRMKKMALEVLEQGLQHRDRTTREVCGKSLSLMKGEISEVQPSQRKPAYGRQRIREASNKGMDGKHSRPKHSPHRR
ncbi:MAG: hypothetical protein JXA82_19090 [Sedimentisphaerales bacterium]|nr:hypothetical protein [Sedimentisphaerales bacterium]